jgi:outer membrane protein assembly factor BamA
MFAISWLDYRDMSEIGQFSFRRWALDSRAFLPLGTRQRVLALRAVLVDSSTTNGNRIPFFMQPTLGGSRTLRGYDSYRFRGEDAMFYQVEYRWEANTAIELALFLDAGTVSDPGESLSFDDLKTDWGIGFRLKTLRSVLFRFDLAWSSETTKTVVRVDAVF